MNTVLIDGCARRGRPRDERIDSDIVGAALGVLADVGFDRFSVEEVALRAGVAKTTVYRRFPSRGDVIAAALEALGDEVEAPGSTGSVRERLVAALGGIRQGTPDSTRGRILMHAMGSDDPGLADLVYDRVLSSRAAALRAIVRDGVISGEVRADVDVDALMSTLVGPMLYLGMWRMRDSVRRVRVEDVVDIVLRGLTPATGW